MEVEDGAIEPDLPNGLVSSEKAEGAGAHGSPWAFVLTMDFKLRKPSTVKGANVLSIYDRTERTPNGIAGRIDCQQVILPKALELGQKLVMAMFRSPLLGYYNAEPGILVAAYGIPELMKAWDVEVRKVEGGTAIPHAFLHGIVEVNVVSIHQEAA